MTGADGLRTDLSSEPAFGKRILLDRARRELDRLHKQSVATLLRQAAAISVRRAPFFDVLASYPLPLQSVKGWRRRARATLRQIESDSTVWADAALVARLSRSPVERWPAATRLAREARRLNDGEFARICFGFALLCEGEAARANRVFNSLLRRTEVLRHRWRVLEGLALAHQALGRHRLALGAMESAAEDSECGVSALVEGLHLALVVGDSRRVRRAAARIDMLVDAYSPRLAVALGRLRARNEQMGPLGVSADRRVRSLRLELAREHRSAAGRVARIAT